MYKTMDKNNYGVIKDVERLENREYEVIGDLYLISHLVKIRPDLIRYDKKTNIAITNCPEKLQIVTNNINGFKDYQFIFIKKEV